MDRYPLDSPDDSSPGWIVIKVNRRRLRTVLQVLTVVLVIVALLVLIVVLGNAFFPR